MSDAEVSLHAQIETLRMQRNQALDAVVELQGLLAAMQSRAASCESALAMIEARQAERNSAAPVDAVGAAGTEPV